MVTKISVCVLWQPCDGCVGHEVSGVVVWPWLLNAQSYELLVFIHVLFSHTRKMVILLASVSIFVTPECKGYFKRNPKKSLFFYCVCSLQVNSL